jgi:hypothetical protein
MEKILGLRPFVPARDFAASKRFYQTLGFTMTLEEDEIAILKLESFSFILQKFYMREFAENCVVQLLVRDAEAWWQRIDGPKLMSEFDVKEPRAPVMQSWGMKVGFLFDPSGVLWHVAEVPF